ncbi:MAG: signal recognition particle-docking protein FtsY [spirochete symbiont of Stewartia floridana]|nr:MAG: signal recognition particle-docking protein FtsY [spirochete symbiont of Stewartia floridana]
MFGKRKNKTPTAPARGSVRNLGSRIRELFSHHSADLNEFFENLEDLLVESDFGALAAVALVDELRQTAQSDSSAWSRQQCLEELKRLIKPSLARAELEPPAKNLALYLVLGVNGVGKTTTIAKLAHRFIRNNLGPVVLAAGDTFRAAAIDQLEIQADRVGARIVKQQHGADPGAVIYDAINAAKSRADSIIIADTAGRMHNRTNLIKELQKIDRIIKTRLGENGCYQKILIVDATTGQNAMKQAEIFHEAIGVDAIIMTKYDSSAKGGLIVAISRKLQIPFAFLGCGEGMDALRPFDPDAYLNELLGPKE